MGRFADPYGDDNRLPAGMIWTGYDADSGQRYYTDTNDASTWVGAPYAEYGVLKLLKRATPAKEDNARYGQKTSKVDSDPPPPQKKHAAQRSQSVQLPEFEASSRHREGYSGPEDGETTKKNRVTRPPPVDTGDGAAHSDWVFPAPRRSIRRPKTSKTEDDPENANVGSNLGRGPESLAASDLTSTPKVFRISRDNQKKPPKNINRAHTLGSWPPDRRAMDTAKASRAKSHKVFKGEKSEGGDGACTESSPKSKSEVNGTNTQEEETCQVVGTATTTSPPSDSPSEIPVGSDDHDEARAEEISVHRATNTPSTSPDRVKKPRPILRQMTQLSRSLLSKF